MAARTEVDVREAVVRAGGRTYQLHPVGPRAWRAVDEASGAVHVFAYEVSEGGGHTSLAATATGRLLARAWLEACTQASRSPLPGEAGGGPTYKMVG